MFDTIVGNLWKIQVVLDRIVLALNVVPFFHSVFFPVFHAVVSIYCHGNKVVTAQHSHRLPRSVETALVPITNISPRWAAEIVEELESSLSYLGLF